MAIGSGEINLRRVIELEEEYNHRQFKRDLRDDLIAAQAQTLQDYGVIIIAYVDRFGAHSELGMIDDKET